MFVAHSNDDNEYLLLDNVVVRGWSEGCAPSYTILFTSTFTGCDMSGWTATTGSPTCPGQTSCGADTDELWVEGTLWTIDKTVDASSLDGDIELCFSYFGDGAGGGESILVEFDTGTGPETAWYQADEMGTDGDCHRVCVNLSDIDPGVNRNPSLRLGFTLASDEIDDEIALDDISLSGAQYCIVDSSVVDLSFPVHRGGGIYEFTATDTNSTQLTADIMCHWDSPTVPVEDMDSVWYRP